MRGYDKRLLDLGVIFFFFVTSRKRNIVSQNQWVTKLKICL